MSESAEPSFAIGMSGQEGEPPRPRPWWRLVLILPILALGLTATIRLLLPNFYHQGCGGQLTVCKSNCKNLATALEMYASDNGGRYPRQLEQLNNTIYLKTLPTCPSAGKITYTNYIVTQNPDSFSFACVGDNHAQAYSSFHKPSRNFPRYNAVDGLIDHP
ncbi:hypothetical protein JST97_16075 [bacterium]|nr:hypothetical protein [bacterium]